MPKFVPVHDVEKPRDAREREDSLTSKHSSFNKSVQPSISTSYGTKDIGSQQIRKSSGNSKMIKNEKGLWVKDTTTTTLFRAVCKALHFLLQKKNILIST